MEALFYVDDMLVALPHMERSQRAFNILIDLFDWIGIRKIVQKMLSMSCQTCYIPSGLLESAYTRQVTGVRPSYQ